MPLAFAATLAAPSPLLDTAETMLHGRKRTQFRALRSGRRFGGCAGLPESIRGPRSAALGAFRTGVYEADQVRFRALRIGTAEVPVVLDEARMPALGAHADSDLVQCHEGGVFP